MAPPSGVLSFARAKSLPEQIADTIVDAISVGQLRSGERIFEADIAEQFNVSRVPVREAMRTLLAQGILQRDGSRGLRVAISDETWLAQLNEARLAVEMIALRHVIARLKADPKAARAIKDSLQRRLDEIRRQARLASPIGMNHADIGFHRELCVAASNNIAMTLWEAIARHVLIVMGKRIQVEADQEAQMAQHQALYDAIVSGDEKRASRELRAHLVEMVQNVAFVDAAVS